MKLTVKTMQKDANGTFDVNDIDPAETVLDVKKKIQNLRSEFDSSSCKLIHQGRILNNEKSVESYSLKEGDFLVIIPGKKAAAPVETQAVSTAAPSEAGGESATSGATATNTTSSSDPNTTTTDNTQTNPTTNPVAGTEAQVASTSAEAEAAVTQLVEMGFPREQCEAALRAAYGNPDRAVEYLMNGIPEQAPAAAPTSNPAVAGGADTNPTVPSIVPGEGHGFQGAAFPGANPGGAGAGAVPGAAGANPLAAMQGPQMEALRAAIMQNPAMLQQMMGQLAQTNPEILQAIQQNPEMLMQILGGGAGAEGGGDDPMGGGAAGAAAPPTVALTPEDRAAVERLEQLGFPRHACIQAYMAAEKNEELAANLLFDMGDDM